MNRDFLLRLLERVAAGRTRIDEAAEQIASLAHENIEYAHIDHHRSLRKGFPEVVYGEGKTAGQIAGIMERIIARERIVLVTRIDPSKAEEIKKRFPGAEYHREPRLMVLKKAPVEDVGRGLITVVSAGTSDIPVAKEAAITAEVMGNRVKTIFDVGVAGIHRLFSYMETLRESTVLVVAAGMEGALPGVVAGLVERPVIAVPTSIGYGTNMSGLTPLFAMLNSCSSNVAVVNIDNGFGAGYMAAVINRS